MTDKPPRKPFDPAATHPRPTIRPAAPVPPPGTPILPRFPTQAEGGFTPLADALRERGLVPPGTAKEAPLVPPHPADKAEFQPPRPLRRPPTRFAAKTPDGETEA